VLPTISGQTGSGKTWTMSGIPENPGLTPRTIAEIFLLKEGLLNVADVSISCYFVELYLDGLRDLFYAMENPRDTKPPKLDIKLDEKKMVFVKGAVVKAAATAQELSALFDAGNRMRKVGGTKMNAESSRSHSIFSVLIEVRNRCVVVLVLVLTVSDLALSA
jgi:Kinesin motor domain